MTKVQVNHISAQKAWELLEKEPKVAFIDVRSDMEYLFIGHPRGAVNIPWITEPDWEINPDFVRRYERGLQEKGQVNNESRKIDIFLSTTLKSNEY